MSLLLLTAEWMFQNEGPRKMQIDRLFDVESGASFPVSFNGAGKQGFITFGQSC